MTLYTNPAAINVDFDFYTDDPNNPPNPGLYCNPSDVESYIPELVDSDGGINELYVVKAILSETKK
jgi:hypothetical protein